MTKQQSSKIASAIDKIIEGLDALKSVVSDMTKPESFVDKFLAESDAPRPQARPVQLKLPLPPVTVDCATRLRLGDVGYENEVNPNRQTCGQIGGLATAGVKRAPCPDRRPRGSVMVKNMSVNEKRRYWRWAKHRAVCRAAGVAPVSWAAWVGERG